jgi:uncharacterized protein
MEIEPPLPPFTLETATAKVQAAENAWNTRDPERVAMAYTEDSEWRGIGPMGMRIGNLPRMV